MILGGGVIGLTTAYYLASEGASVTVLDRNDFGQKASWAGAGIVPPGNPTGAKSPIERMRAVSSAAFPGLSASLRDETGIDNGYLVCGGIELPDDGGLPTEAWRDEGIAFEALDHAGLKRAEPEISPVFASGYLLPGMAQVRNPRHIKALIAACSERAVGLNPGCLALGFLKAGDRITGVETEQGRMTAGQYLIATGAWTDELVAQLGWKPGIAPVRGQIALVNSGHASIRPIILLGKRYLVPRPDGRVLAGATEEDVGFDARPTAGGIAGLLAFAEQLIPSLRDATMERCWAGLRPGSPDGQPFLGLVPGYSNLYVSAGHFRAGIQLSPATGMAMMEMMLGLATSVPIEAFRPDRPMALPAETAFRS
jgi:glycine oxidase